MRQYPQPWTDEPPDLEWRASMPDGVWAFVLAALALLAAIGVAVMSAAP